MIEQNGQSGFGLIEIALVIIVAGVLGATGWYALNSKHKTDQILDQAAKISQEATVKNATQPIKTFDQCQAAAGSKILQSLPEVCVSKDGQRFTQ